jgi:protein-S-isoprenylcysteine O-methyltransferase Ste14
MNNDAIHTTLARSYIAYFVCSMVGLLADALFGFVVPVPQGTLIALVCFAVGPALIWWAQHTSRTSVSAAAGTTYFNRGPYRFLRNPTHLGIVILVAGYAAVTGSMIFLFVTLIGYMISNHFFKRYETILRITYGEDYKEYESSTPKVL